MSEDDATSVEAEVTVLEEAPNPDEIVLDVSLGGEILHVTRAAKASMGSALDAVANQPTVYFRCRFAVGAVTDILSVDMNEYSMPQTEEDLKAFDWDSLVPGRKDTYPQGTPPTDNDFAKVKAVHGIVREEKDKEARVRGLPKSGVQSYCTYKQRWKQWRDICAVYRHMEPIMELPTVAALIMGRLKLCNSLTAIDEIMM